MSTTGPANSQVSTMVVVSRISVDSRDYQGFPGLLIVGKVILDALARQARDMHGCNRHLFEVGVGEHDRWVLAAKFERDVLDCGLRRTPVIRSAPCRG